MSDLKIALTLPESTSRELRSSLDNIAKATPDQFDAVKAAAAHALEAAVGHREMALRLIVAMRAIERGHPDPRAVARAVLAGDKVRA